jgi:hypothetical protein
MNRDPNGSLSSVPNGKIVEFEKAELRRTPSHDSLYLWVRGQLPGAGYKPTLAPRVYFGRPDYWGIEVAAIASLEAASDSAGAGDSLFFECSVPLTGITGTQGVAVIGANQVTRIEIAGESF